MRRLVLLWIALATLPASSWPSEGTAAAGEALYMGARRLEHGGAPCLACHALADHGLAWSATFGPDLSAIGASYDPATLDAALQDVPFPSMAPIYRAHTITASERADLVAFLATVHPVPAAGHARERIALEALAVAAAIFALLVVATRRRMPPLRDALGRGRAGGGAP